MELQQLRYFLEVAQTQHVTHSAEKLHIAQPSLSQAIKRLENELGVQLFAASGRNIVLTESGRFLQEKLAPIMQQLDAIPEQIRENADPESATVRLHVTAASRIVSDAIVEYRRRHEKVNFQFIVNDDQSLFDLSISTALRGPSDEETGGDCFVCSEKICLAVPNTGRYAGMRTARLADFRNAGFISLIALKQFRQICDRLCAKAGFVPRVVFESDNPDTVRNMIAANMGVGFWPAFTWGSLRSEHVRLLDIEEPVCRRSIVVTRCRNRTDSGAAEDFFDFLVRHIAAKAQSSGRDE